MPGELDRLLIRLEADTSILRRALANADKQVAGFGKTVDRQLARSERRFLSFSKIGARAFAGLSVGYLAKETLSLADTYRNLENRLKFVTNSSDDLRYVQERLFEISQETHQSLTDTTELYARMAFALKDVGATQGEVLQFTENLNKALVLSGASGAEASGALTQLSQGLASGTLRGQELNSVLEQTPYLAELIARQLGVTTGQLRKLGEQGKITGREVFDAITGASKELDDQFKKTVPTVAQGFTELENSVLNFVGRADAATGASAALAEALRAIAKQIDDLQNAPIVGLAQKLATFASVANPANWPAAAAGMAGQYLGRQAHNAMFPPQPGQPPVPVRKPLDRSATRIGTSTTPAIAPFETSIDTSGADALRGLDKQWADARGDRLAVIQSEADEELRKFQEMLDAKKISEEEFARARYQISDITASKVSAELEREAQEYRAHFAEVESLFENAFMNVFTDALHTGEVNAKKFFLEITEGLAKITFQALVLKPLLGGLFSAVGAGPLGPALSGVFGGALASGGPVKPGKAHLVGEQGPELFVPNSSGRVLNAATTRTAMSGGASGGSASNSTTYNIDARGADISVAERIERALAASERARREPVSAVGGYERRHPYRSH